jgi:hypothetical protein
MKLFCKHKYEYQPFNDKGCKESLFELKSFKWEVKTIREASYWKCNKCGKLLTLYGPNIIGEK